ncbi:SDR family oxidoreductase [Acidocella sp.]|uniref:SDR family oxidoreductase n=1 Tax=Acidocella sp. TaxID=50710 RepID=UPI003D064BE3
MGVRDLFSLAGKTALVTGGSRGLGLQIARGLAEAGARVGITARKPEELADAAAALRRTGHEIEVFACDLAKDGEAARLAADALARFGRLDILVNNAGTSWSAPAELYPAEGWNKVMRLNLDAVFFLTQAIARQVMIPAGSGKIINIASIGGLGGNAPGIEMHTVAYNASKAALINMTQALAVEWGRHNINVNAICPGWFPSKMSGELLKQHEDLFLSRIPLGRFGGEEDLQGVALLLAAEAGRHITGQAIVVDGGETA